MLEDIMANEITANELKVKGITAIDDVTSNGFEAIITVRGKQKYVVMTMEEYNKLREFELEAAIIQSETDMKNGKYKKGSVENHIKRLENV
jgi:hypothetical protein